MYRLCLLSFYLYSSHVAYFQLRRSYG